MARPPAKELTDRELEVMHLFWQRGEQTAQEARDELARQGLDLAYTTVATLVRILHDKGFLVPVNDERPFRYRPVRPFAEVSRRLVDDLVERVFQGSRRQLLKCLYDEDQLSARERAALEAVLAEEER